MGVPIKNPQQNGSSLFEYLMIRNTRKKMVEAPAVKGLYRVGTSPILAELGSGLIFRKAHASIEYLFGGVHVDLRCRATGS